MRSPKAAFFPVIILMLAILACTSPFGGETPTLAPTSQEDEVATIVAATLAVSERGGGEGAEPEANDPPADPTATTPPEPTATPTTPVPTLKVAYVNAGDVWLWTEGAGHTQLTTAGAAVDVHISEDGQVIAFTRQFDFYYEELWAINADGSNERLLVSRADFEAMPRGADYFITQRPYQIDWVPGTHTLAFNTNPAFEGPGLFVNDDLHLVDADTGQRTLLLEPGFGGMFHYSPDGTQIAVVTPETLSLVDTRGGNRRDILVFPIIYTYSEWTFYPTPIWAADASYLRVAVPPQDPLANPEALTFVWHIPADGNLPHMAGEFVSAPVFRGAPTISPDTNKVIYALPIGEAFDQFELHHRDLTDGTDTIYLTGQFFLENWNPDSARFVYTGAVEQKLFIGQIGAPATPATDQTNTFDPRWVDADQLIFYAQPSPNAGFFLNISTVGGPSSVIAGPFEQPNAFDFTK